VTAYHDRLTAGNYTTPPSAAELEEKTVAHLKADLENRGLATTGSKTELIERLATSDTDA
jgi:hypothetical protein